MKTITRKCKPNRKLSPRQKRVEIDRKRRKAWALEITLPLHDLSDRMRYKSHRYHFDPEFFAVRTSEEIKQHDLVKVDGEILKVVSVEQVSEGCLEIRTVRFERYNR